MKTWRKLSGDSFSQMQNVDLELITRYLEFNQIEEDVKKEKAKHAKS